MCWFWIKLIICFYEVITVSWLGSWIWQVNLDWPGSIQYVIISILTKISSWIFFSQIIFLLVVRVAFEPIKSIESISTRFKFFILKSMFIVSGHFFEVKKINLTCSVMLANDLVLSKALFVCWKNFSWKTFS